MTLLSQKTRENENKKLFSLNVIFQNFKQKEHRHIITKKINLARESDNQREKIREDREDHNDDFKKNEKLRKNNKDDREDRNDRKNKSRHRSSKHLFKKYHECDEERHKWYECSKASKEKEKEKDVKNSFEFENIENSLKQTSDSFIEMLKII